MARSDLEEVVLGIEEKIFSEKLLRIAKK